MYITFMSLSKAYPHPLIYKYNLLFKLELMYLKRDNYIITSYYKVYE